MISKLNVWFCVKRELNGYGEFELVGGRERGRERERRSLAISSKIAERNFTSTL